MITLDHVLNIPRFTAVDAEYEPYPLSRYRGNPLVEALRLSSFGGKELSKESLHNAIERLPDRPDAKTRAASDFYRQAELDNVCNIVVARPAYRNALSGMLTTLLNAYANRNPVLGNTLRQRDELASMDVKDLFLDEQLTRTGRFQDGWGGSAGGYGVFGSTGSGKTTLLRGLGRLTGKVIRHTGYRGHEFHALQIPVIQMSVPHDATMRAFVLQFAKIVDYQLGQSLYEKQARSARTVAGGALLMLQICAAINLGALIVDDLQNLRAARGPGVEIALNLLALLIDFGTSVITSGTPAIGELVKKSARNARKLVSHGYVELRMMPNDSAELRSFQDQYWDYQYTKKRTKMTPEIRAAWAAAGAGNPAFSTLAYKLVQVHLIGEEDETITPGIFGHVAQIDMALLKPAIDALNSNDPELLGMFDDLVFKEELTSLFGAINVNQTPPAHDAGEYGDEPEGSGQPKALGRPTAPITRKLALPTEDPLVLMALH